MSKRVNVSLTVDLEDNGEKSCTKIQESGLLSESKGSLRLWYSEPLEEGFSVVTEVTVTVTADGLGIYRSGFVSSDMILRAGEESVWKYQTPYGVMEFPVSCSKLCNELAPTGGRLFAEYCVNTEGNSQGIHATMEYLVEEVQE